MEKRDLDEAVADAVANEPSPGELSAQIEALKADIAGIAETLGALGKARGASLVGGAQDAAYTLKARGEEKVAQLQQRAASMTAQAEDAVRENPQTALGIAAGLGFLFGVILSRR